MQAKTNITLRITKKSEPIFNRVEKIAKNKNSGQFAPTLLELLELGLKSYEEGYRVLDSEVVKKVDIYKNGERTVYSVENEVAKSLYTSLAGAICDLGRYEEAKEKPNQELIKFYILIEKALWAEHSKFYTFTDKQIRIKEVLISSILKSITLVETKHEEQSIIEKNRNALNKLIIDTGVKS